MCIVPSAPGRAASENGRLCRGDRPPGHASPPSHGLDVDYPPTPTSVDDHPDGGSPRRVGRRARHAVVARHRALYCRIGRCYHSFAEFR
jgi:hypothetical protein